MTEMHFLLSMDPCCATLISIQNSIWLRGNSFWALWTKSKYSSSQKWKDDGLQNCHFYKYIFRWILSKFVIYDQFMHAPPRCDLAILLISIKVSQKRLTFFLFFFLLSAYIQWSNRHSLVTLKTEMSLHNFECIYFYDYYRVAFIIIFISNRVSIWFEAMLSLSSYLNWDFLVFMRKRQINHWNIKKLAKY